MADNDGSIDVTTLLNKLQGKIGELITTVAMLEIKLDTLQLSHERELDIVRRSHAREIDILRKSLEKSED